MDVVAPNVKSAIRYVSVETKQILKLKSIFASWFKQGLQSLQEQMNLI